MILQLIQHPDEGTAFYHHGLMMPMMKVSQLELSVEETIAGVALESKDLGTLFDQHHHDHQCHIMNVNGTNSIGMVH